MINYTTHPIAAILEVVVPMFAGTVVTCELVKRIFPRKSIILTIAFTQLAFLANVIAPSFTNPNSSGDLWHIPNSYGRLFFGLAAGSASSLCSAIFARHYPHALVHAAPPIAIIPASILGT